MKFLVSRGIRGSYKKVIDVLQFPVLSATDGQELSDAPIAAHLQKIKNSNMNMAVEMQELIDREVLLLKGGCRGI
jgi:hypothetical protein